jgi:hypothetical protein
VTITALPLAAVPGPKPGDVLRVLCTATDGALITAAVPARTADRLGCGCWRVRTWRPGPAGEETGEHMEVIFQRCARTHEPAPVRGEVTITDHAICSRCECPLPAGAPAWVDGDETYCADCAPEGN